MKDLTFMKHVMLYKFSWLIYKINTSLLDLKICEALVFLCSLDVVVKLSVGIMNLMMMHGFTMLFLHEL